MSYVQLRDRILKVFERALYSPVGIDAADLEFLGPSDIPVTDFCIRRFIQDAAASGVPRVEKIQKAIEIVRLLSENGKLKDRRGIALIEEIFELLPLDECELIFEYLEKRSSWLQKLGAELPPTNQFPLLQNFLSRVSKGTDADIRGRALCMAGSLVSMYNISTSNFNGHANAASKLEYDTSVEDDDILATEDTEGYHVSGRMYKSFWSFLQRIHDIDALKEELQSASVAKSFINNLEGFIKIFEQSADKVSWTHDALSSSKSGLSEGGDEQDQDDSLPPIADMFFDKYLTSPRLLAFQMQSVSFRRVVLGQLVMSLHAATNPGIRGAKEKPLEASILTSLQGCSKRADKILSRTPPHGRDYSRTLSKVLDREPLWTEWKGARCPPLPDMPKLRAAREREKAKRKEKEEGEAEEGEVASSAAPPLSASTDTMVAKRIKIGESTDGSSNAGVQYVDLGSPALSQLWGYKRLSSADFLPTLEQLVEANGGDTAVFHENTVARWQASRLLVSNYLAPVHSIIAPKGLSIKTCRTEDLVNFILKPDYVMPDRPAIVLPPITIRSRSPPPISRSVSPAPPPSSTTAAAASGDAMDVDAPQRTSSARAESDKSLEAGEVAADDSESSSSNRRSRYGDRRGGSERERDRERDRDREKEREKERDRERDKEREKERERERERDKASDRDNKSPEARGQTQSVQQTTTSAAITKADAQPTATKASGGATTLRDTERETALRDRLMEGSAHRLGLGLAKSILDRVGVAPSASGATARSDRKTRDEDTKDHEREREREKEGEGKEQEGGGSASSGGGRGGLRRLRGSAVPAAATTPSATTASSSTSTPVSATAAPAPSRGGRGRRDAAPSAVSVSSSKDDGKNADRKEDQASSHDNSRQPSERRQGGSGGRRRKGH